MKLKMWILIDKDEKVVKIPVFNDEGNYADVYGFTTKKDLLDSIDYEKGDRAHKIEVEI